MSEKGKSDSCVLSPSEEISDSCVFLQCYIISDNSVSLAAREISGTCALLHALGYI